MKKFRFRLDSVLRVRRIQEDLARAQLLAANRDVLLATDALRARDSEYAAVDRPAGQQSLDAFHLALFRLDSAAGAVRVARDARAAALDRAEERRVEWTAASQKVSALERLEERARDEHAVEVRRDEDRLVDDLVVSRHRAVRIPSPARHRLGARP